MEIVEVFTEDGRLQLSVAIDRDSKFVYAELHEKKMKKIVARFLCNEIARIPYRIHTILTDSGLQFARSRNRGYRVADHVFDSKRHANSIEHRLTKKNRKDLKKNSPAKVWYQTIYLVLAWPEAISNETASISKTHML